MKLRRRRYAGNTLAEYALPMALVVVASGVIAASVNIQNILPQFFAEAGGSTVGPTMIAAASGTTGPSNATGDGSGQLPGVNANAGQTGLGLGLEGLVEPNIEVSGSEGTQVALGLMNTSGPDIDAESDDADYEAGSMYVAMVKDLALTTASADEATQSSDSSGDTAQSNAILDEYASAVAAKGNAIQQYAFANVVEVLRHGGIAGLQQVDDHVEVSEDQFDAGDDSQADHHGEQEEVAVEDDTMTDAQTDSDVTAAQQDGFLWTLNLYQNTQYTPIEPEVFAAWRASSMDPRFGPTTIWALDYEGNVSVLSQSWGAFLPQE